MNYKQNATPCVSRILGDVCAQWEYPDAERAIGIAPAQNEPRHFHFSAMQETSPNLGSDLAVPLRPQKEHIGKFRCLLKVAPTSGGFS